MRGMAVLRITPPAVRPVKRDGAALLGHEPVELSSIGGSPSVLPQHTVLVGIRNLDEQEKAHRTASRALEELTPERRRLVAMRAAFSLPYGVLLRYTPDPLGDLVAEPSLDDAGMLLVCLIWGVNFSVSKFAIEQMPVLPFTAMRFAGASLLLWIIVRVTEGPGEFSGVGFTGLLPGDSLLFSDTGERIARTHKIVAVLYRKILFKPFDFKERLGLLFYCG